MKKTVLVFTALTMLLCATLPNAFAGPALDKILERGELLVGTTATQPPFNAKNKDGNLIGLDVDLGKLIALNMGVEVKFVTMPFAELLPAMSAGKIDMILSGMTMTMERNLGVAFVGPYYVSGKGMLTKSDNITTLQDADGLNNPDITVGALKDSTSQQFIEMTAPKAKLVATASYDEAVQYLLGGKLDAIVADYPFCALTAHRLRDKEIVSGQSRLTFEPLGIAVPEDTLLINWIGNFMLQLEGSGQLKKIGQHWLNPEVWDKIDQ